MIGFNSGGGVGVCKVSFDHTFIQIHTINKGTNNNKEINKKEEKINQA